MFQPFLNTYLACSWKKSWYWWLIGSCFCCSLPRVRFRKKYCGFCQQNSEKIVFYRIQSLNFKLCFYETLENLGISRITKTLETLLPTVCWSSSFTKCSALFLHFFGKVHHFYINLPRHSSHLNEIVSFARIYPFIKLTLQTLSASQNNSLTTCQKHDVKSRFHIQNFFWWILAVFIPQPEKLSMITF